MMGFAIMREERIIALPILREYPRELLHKRLVRHVEPQWRHRNAVFGHGRHIGTALPLLTAVGYVSDPIIGIAAAIVALIDPQAFLVMTALVGNRDALDVVRHAVWKIHIDQHITRDSCRKRAPNDIGSKADRRLPKGRLATP